MSVVKRYSNRKLYDVATKQYVSLEGLAEMIRRGEDVQVVDHATGEDLTTLTLTQIIVGQEKLRGGFVPGPVLTGLIRSGGNTLAALARSLMAPLDLLRQVDDEIDLRIRRLVGLGDLAESEGQRLADKLRSVGARSKMEPDDVSLVQQLAQRSLPTCADLETLSDLVDRLSAELDQLMAGRASER